MVYRMWPNGPTLELPDDYHWDPEKKEIVKNDGSWHGDLLQFFHHQHATEISDDE